MLTVRGEFKGNKTIGLKRTEEDEYPFTFGKKKAQLIVTHMDEIKAFAEEPDEKGTGEDSG